MNNWDLTPFIQATLAALASAKGVDFSALINDLLKKDIELIEVARKSVDGPAPMEVDACFW